MFILLIVVLCSCNCKRMPKKLKKSLSKFKNQIIAEVQSLVKKQTETPRQMVQTANPQNEQDKRNLMLGGMMGGGGSIMGGLFDNPAKDWAKIKNQMLHELIDQKMIMNSVEVNNARLLRYADMDVASTTSTMSSIFDNLVEALRERKEDFEKLYAQMELSQV